MATVKFFLKDPHATTLTLIYLYIMAGNERFKVSTTRKIAPNHWDQQKQQARRGHPGFAELNIFLNTLAVETDKIYNRFLSTRQPFSLEDVKEAVRNSNTSKPKDPDAPLTSFITEYIERCVPLKSHTTIKAYQNTLNHLIAYQRKYGNRKLTFESIDLEFYDKFTGFLFTDKLLSNNSVSNQIKNLKVFLNEATELGLNKKFDYKKKRFKKWDQQSDSIYLNEDEIRALFDLDLSPTLSLDRVRDLFIIGCWTGLRFSDFTQLGKENISREMISIRTRKTDIPVMIPIHPMVKKIFAKYTKDKTVLLPHAISNQKMNDYLKKVAEKAGLDNPVVISISRGNAKHKVTYPKYELVTSHTARRSFATNLYLQGFPAISIMKITGHTTEKAFLKYIKVSPEENARKLMAFWKEKHAE